MKSLIEFKFYDNLLNMSSVKDYSDLIAKEKVTICIDFDGVIHNSNKGFYNGKCYGNPINGTYEALKELSENYSLVIYSCKANPDRPLIDGNTGVELVWEWLDKYKMIDFIDDVVFGKPHALVYIDDKAIRFDSWTRALVDLKKLI